VHVQTLQRREQHPPRQPQATPPAQQERRALATARSLFAELLGTFALTFVAAGADVIAATSGGQVGEAAKVVAPGLVVMALIYAIGEISGAHFNPAVTSAFVMRGVFPLRRLPAYWMAQLAGALIAALLLRQLFGDADHLGATLPHHGASASFVMEAVLTWLLVSVILGTATQARLVGPNAAIAVGATIALDGLFAAPISGASMNPARSLGPAIVGGATTGWWIYVAAPLLGAAVAAGCCWLLNGSQRDGEVEVAQGKEGQRADHGREPGD
jgi:aquaporin Z